MTYLKLRKPGIERAAFFFIPVPTGELYSEIILDMDDEAIKDQLKVHENNGYSPRKFLFWARMDDGSLQTKHARLLEVVIPGDGRDIEPKAFITNYDVFLVNSEGNLIERLHRYYLPDGADGNVGGGVLQHGTDSDIVETEEGYQHAG